MATKKKKNPIVENAKTTIGTDDYLNFYASIKRIQE